MSSKQGLFKRNTKLTTLFWVAISGLILTTIYSFIILIQGYKAQKMVKFIYKKIKQSTDSETQSE